MTAASNPRPRLSLGTKPEAAPNVAAQTGEMNGGATPAPPKKGGAPTAPKRPNNNFDHAVANTIKEFAFPDGRPISIIRHAIVFATPFNGEEGCTLIASKGGGKPFPIRVAYADFVGWWRAEK